MAVDSLERRKERYRNLIKDLVTTEPLKRTEWVYGNTSPQSTVIVGVRIRPPPSRDLCVSALPLPEGGVISIKVDNNFHLYAFDVIFPPQATNFEVWATMVRPCVDKLLMGVGGAIVAYGGTGSGKSYTMGFEDTDTIGQLHYIAKHLFGILQHHKCNLAVYMCYIEIYGNQPHPSGDNAEVTDLLDPERRSYKSHNINKVYSNISHRRVFSAEDFITVFCEANSKRQIGSQTLNAKSSRSHGIVQIVLADDNFLVKPFTFSDKRTVSHCNDIPKRMNKNTNPLLKKDRPNTSHGTPAHGNTKSMNNMREYMPVCYCHDKPFTPGYNSSSTKITQIPYDFLDTVSISKMVETINKLNDCYQCKSNSISLELPQLPHLPREKILLEYPKIDISQEQLSINRITELEEQDLYVVNDKSHLEQKFNNLNLYNEDQPLKNEDVHSISLENLLPTNDIIVNNHKFNKHTKDDTLEYSGRMCFSLRESIEVFNNSRDNKNITEPSILLLPARSRSVNSKPWRGHSDHCIIKNRVMTSTRIYENFNPCSSEKKQVLNETLDNLCHGKFKNDLFSKTKCDFDIGSEEEYCSSVNFDSRKSNSYLPEPILDSTIYNCNSVRRMPNSLKKDMKPHLRSNRFNVDDSNNKNSHIGFEYGIFASSPKISYHAAMNALLREGLNRSSSQSESNKTSGHITWGYFDSTVKWSRLSVVDLAGCEPAHMWRNNSDGNSINKIRYQEAVVINQGLGTLRSCIAAMAGRPGAIGNRNQSMLTKLLAEYFDKTSKRFKPYYLRVLCTVNPVVGIQGSVAFLSKATLDYAKDIKALKIEKATERNLIKMYLENEKKMKEDQMEGVEDEHSWVPAHTKTMQTDALLEASACPGPRRVYKSIPGATLPDYLSNREISNRFIVKQGKQVEALGREERQEYIFKNGGRYKGQWRGPLRDGLGSVVWQDGASYSGEWKNDRAHGTGRFVHTDGDVYIGEWREDKANGYGKYVHTDGSQYCGQWVNDMQHGNGKETWPDGAWYNGQFNRGNKEGVGEFRWTDGSGYVGEFYDNQFSGYGVYTWPDGRIYEGQWRNNRIHGRGTFTWPNGRKYEGEYVNDSKHGWGRYIFEDGRIIEGKWDNGTRVREEKASKNTPVKA